MTRTPSQRAHPYIPEFAEPLREGEIPRREFLGGASRLGLSAAAAYAMVGSITGERPVPAARAAYQF